MRNAFGWGRARAVLTDMEACASQVVHETDKLAGKFDTIKSDADALEVDPMALMILRVKSAKLRRDVHSGAG